MNDRKVRALMQIIEMIVAGHYRGLLVLGIELREMARSIVQASNEGDLQKVLTKLAEFNK